MRVGPQRLRRPNWGKSIKTTADRVLVDVPHPFYQTKSTQRNLCLVKKKTSIIYLDRLVRRFGKSRYMRFFFLSFPARIQRYIHNSSKCAVDSDCGTMSG